MNCKKNIKKKYRLLTAKESIGKIVHTELGHIAVAISLDDDMIRCVVIRPSVKYPIGDAKGKIRILSAPYIELSKKYIKSLYSETIDANIEEELRSNFSRAKECLNNYS